MFKSEKVLETLEGMVYFSRFDRFFLLCPNVTLTYSHKSSDGWLVFNVLNFLKLFLKKLNQVFYIEKFRVKL